MTAAIVTAAFLVFLVWLAAVCREFVRRELGHGRHRAARTTAYLVVEGWAR